MQASLHRVEVEDAVSLDDDLSVERRALRQELLERPKLGEVAQERSRISRPEPELTGRVLEDPSEAVPLRLVLPAVGLGQLANELCLHRWERDRGVELVRPLDGLAAGKAAAGAARRERYSQRPVAEHDAIDLPRETLVLLCQSTLQQLDDEAILRADGLFERIRRSQYGKESRTEARPDDECRQK